MGLKVMRIAFSIFILQQALQYKKPVLILIYYYTNQ